MRCHANSSEVRGEAVLGRVFRVLVVDVLLELGELGGLQRDETGNGRGEAVSGRTRAHGYTFLTRLSTFLGPHNSQIGRCCGRSGTEWSERQLWT